MASYNRVILLGNLTRDPEMRYTANNTPIVKIGIAVNDRVKNRDSDQWEDRPNFFDCTAFGRVAELINQYFSKGKPIFIEGKLRWDSWEDRQSGQRRSKVEVIIDNFQFIAGRDDNGGNGGRSGGGGGRGDYNRGGGGGGGGYSNAGNGGGHDAGSYDSGPQHEPVSEDDIPF